MATLCTDAITSSSRSASSEPISPDLPPCSSCSPPIHLLSPHNQEEEAKNPSARGRKEGKEDEGDALPARRQTRRSSPPVRRRALAPCLRPPSPRAPGCRAARLWTPLSWIHCWILEVRIDSSVERAGMARFHSGLGLNERRFRAGSDFKPGHFIPVGLKSIPGHSGP